MPYKIQLIHSNKQAKHSKEVMQKNIIITKVKSYIMMLGRLHFHSVNYKTHEVAKNLLKHILAPRSRAYPSR